MADEGCGWTQYDQRARNAETGFSLEGIMHDDMLSGASGKVKLSSMI